MRLRPPLPSVLRPAAAPRPWPARHPARRSGLGIWLAWALLLGSVLLAAGTEVRAEGRPEREAPARARPCADCGVVTAVARIDAPGRATGVGAAVGGAVGWMIGRELGRESGRHGGRHGGAPPTAVLGAVGGGLIGHQIEKRVRQRTVYEVDVRMADGRVRQLSQPHPVRVGERVTVRQGQAWPEGDAPAPPREAPAPEPLPPWRGERA